MKSATPKPQAPFRSSAPTMRSGFQPPPIGRPFIGKTTKNATSVGRIAPRTIARSQYFDPAAPRIISHSAIPHTPPQNASDSTDGTPIGGVGVMTHGLRGVIRNPWRSASTPWWKTSVERKPARNAFAYDMDGELYRRP